MNNYREINLVIKAEECPYWNYENQTCPHTCRDCHCLREGNNINNAEFGVMIDGNRYCTLSCDVYGEIIKTLNKKEKIKKYTTCLKEIIDDIENAL